MKIVALCKTNSCNEFIEAILETIYEDMFRIVFVHSDVNWLGVNTGDEVEPVVSAWKKANDTVDKIVQLKYPIDATVDQMAQYNYGYRYIVDQYKPDWIYVFDSDELIDFENLRRLKKLMGKAFDYNSIASMMHTYLKSPFYRVNPPEFCRPAVAIRPVRGAMQGIRGNATWPRLLDENLYFHHYTYVRLNEEDVFKKIYTSLSGDREDVPQTNLVDMKTWRTEKWDKLPYSTDLHTTLYFEKSWKKVIEIGINDVPITLRNKPIIQKYLNVKEFDK